MLLMQSFSKLLPNVTRNLGNITVIFLFYFNRKKKSKSKIGLNLEKMTDLSNEMSNLKRSLMIASRELENDGRLSPMIPISLDQSGFKKLVPSHCFPPNSKELFIWSILESIKQEMFTSAIEYFKLAQKHWPNDFNKTNQTPNEFDFDLILVLNCEQARQKYSSDFFFQ